MCTARLNNLQATISIALLAQSTARRFLVYFSCLCFQLHTHSVSFLARTATNTRRKKERTRKVPVPESAEAPGNSALMILLPAFDQLSQLPAGVGNLGMRTL
jgi:Ca2+/H+ antiporter